MGQQESDLAAVRQERDFWMEQCQQKEDVQQTSTQSPTNDQELEALKKVNLSILLTRFIYLPLSL